MDCYRSVDHRFCWSEVGDSQLTGLEMVRETTENIVQIKNCLLATRSRQNSYVDVRCKPLEFDVDLKKCLSDEGLVIPLEEIQLDDKLYFINDPVEIIDREYKEVTTAQVKVSVVQELQRIILDMDQDSTHMVAASKVPMLKPENGATLPKTQIMDGVVTMMPITTAKKKAQRRLEVKARRTLMMGIPNEHQLKLNFIKDAKQFLEAVEKRFGENVATKKTQRNLLKQQFENFSAPSSEMLDQTFDRLQNLVSQLKLLGEKLSQEDVNQKLLRSLSPEWNTHVVVWRNKADLDTMSMNDLYNNLKVYEPEVKGMSSSNGFSVLYK
uniref:Uncharacterized protein n=1 Tax=Tanacetum cinerariifolium TaxID=118510 RepID=A0A6L2JPQ4_TANCI|nr:hypothetical protein [Tanacetum cinerariifolium]